MSLRPRKLTPAIAVIAVLAVALLSACTSSRAAASKSITWYTTMQAQDAQPIIDAFTKQTGIQVNLYTAATPTVWQRFEQEESSGRHTADVFTTTDESIEQSGVSGGYFAKLPSGSNIKAYPAQYVDPDGYWLSLRATIIGIVYNTKLVTGANVPTTWSDLLKPFWKGKLNVTDPQLTTTGYFADWQLGHESGLGQQFLSALGAQKPAILAHTGQQVNNVISGDDYAAITSDDAVWPQIQTGAPVKMVYPSDGVANYADYTSVVKDAPNPTGATAFVNFLASPTAGALIAKTGAYSPIQGVAAVPAARPPLSSLTLLPGDIGPALSDRTAYLGQLKQLGLATTS